MLSDADTHSLTGFLQDHETHLERLRESGRPEILTVDGEASVVVQDAEAYQDMLNRLDALDAEGTLRERLASLDAGEPGVPADQVLADIRDQLGIKKG